MTQFKHGMLAGAIAALLAAGAASGAQAQGRTAWEGTHFGGHLGWDDNSYDANSNSGASALTTNLGDKDGFAGGLLYGASIQSNNWVLGTDSVLTFGELDSSAATTAAGLTFSAETNYQTETRARVGYLALPDILIYGTAGIAFADVDVKGNALADGGDDKTFFGYTYGGGVEMMFSERWFARVEYVHSEFDDANFAAIGGGSHEVDLDSDAVRTAFGYRFDWSPLDLLR